MKCTNCRRKLYQGLDVFQVRQGVIGTRGFVPLDETILCSDRCLSAYYADPTSDEREDQASFS